MLNVLVTMPFSEAQLDRMRRVSPSLTVTREGPDAADYARADVLYAGTPPRDLARAPRLKWVQLHMAGVNALYDHPLYTDSAVTLTTTSGVHAATIAEYAITVLLALSHRVPGMVEWQRRGGWPPDEQRWSLFVPTEVRGATLGIIGYGSIGRELRASPRPRSPCACWPASVTLLSAWTLTTACRVPVIRRVDFPDAWLSPARLPSTRALRRGRDGRAADPGHASHDRRAGAGGHEALGVLHQRRARRPVDEAALARALADGRIAAAAVDVFAQEPPPPGHPLYALDNVILSPHVSGFVPSMTTGARTCSPRICGAIWPAARCSIRWTAPGATECDH